MVVGSWLCTVENKKSSNEWGWLCVGRDDQGREKERTTRVYKKSSGRKEFQPMKAAEKYFFIRELRSNEKVYIYIYIYSRLFTGVLHNHIYIYIYLRGFAGDFDRKFRASLKNNALSSMRNASIEWIGRGCRNVIRVTQVKELIYYRVPTKQRAERRRNSGFGWVTRSRYVEPLSEVTIDRIIRDVCEFDRSYPSQISVISSNDCSPLYTSPVLQPRAELQRNRHDTTDRNRE